MAQNKRNPEATKKALLKAAGDVLVEKGLYGFHVHEVANRAGFGKPLVYRYFGDRDQLLDALAVSRAGQVQKQLEKIQVPEGGTLSPGVYRQIMFARLLAGDPVLRALFRAQLGGDLGESSSRALNDLIPHSGKQGDAGAAEAFLLAGISYILLLRDSLPECSGVPIQTPRDLAAFERAFVGMAQKT